PAVCSEGHPTGALSLQPYRPTILDLNGKRQIAKGKLKNKRPEDRDLVASPGHPEPSALRVEIFFRQEGFTVTYTSVPLRLTSSSVGLSVDLRIAARSSSIDLTD